MNKSEEPVVSGIAAPALLDSFSIWIGREASRAFTLRLVPLSILFSVVVLGAGLKAGAEFEVFIKPWIVLGGIQYGLVSYLRRSRNLERAGLVTLIAVTGLLCWWFLLPFLSPQKEFFVWELLLALLAMVTAFLPFSTRHSVTLACMLLVVTLNLVAYAELSVPLLLLGIMVLLVAIGYAAESRISFALRACHCFLGRYCESSAAVVSTTVQLLTRQLLVLADEKVALLATGAEQLDIVSSSGISRESNALIAKALYQTVIDAQLEQGVLERTKMHQSFVPQLGKWFGYVPRSVFFVGFSTVVGDSEKKVFIFIPLSFASRMSDLTGLLNAFSSLISVVRVAMLSARSRFISSDALLVSERLLLKKDEELATVVHEVNNAAQDITVLGDEIKKILELSPSDLADKDKGERCIHQLESVSRGLSASVSDVRLLAEMSRVRSLSRYERVDLSQAVDEVSSYAQWLALRGYSEVKLEERCGPDAALKVVSREYLNTALRTILRRVVLREKSEAVLVLLKESERINFSFRGPALNAPGERWSEALKSISNFCRLCGGELRVLSAEGAPCAIDLLMPQAPLGEVKLKGPAPAKVLFVDDNPQVLGFYERVSSAMGLDFVGATSCSEAIGKLEGDAAPPVVVTDLQLGAENGLELISVIKARFEGRTKVVVVSGMADGGTKAQAMAAGAFLFLAKPVSRSRLFSELKKIIFTEV